MRKSDKFAWFIATLFVLFVLIFIDQRIAGVFDKHDEKRVMIDIRKGESLSKIAQMLEDSGVIESKEIFKFFAKVTKTEGKLQAGKYQLSKSMNEFKALDKIHKGRVILKPVLITEGLTYKQIASRFKETAGKDSLLIVRLCENKEFLKKNKVNAKNAEGFLFPDTYYISDETSEEEIVGMMLKRFSQELPDSLFKKNEFGFSKYEYIILASMIEKEAKIDSEKPLIAGVYYNRLKKGMLLQCCATVFYAQNRKGGKLTYNDLEFSSPYNTYKNPGLPPTPICSPSLSSVDAALNPAMTKYLFYVSNGDGTHTFTTNYKDHIKAQRD
ncbi:MAG: endolytic transglycosylase MltG [bacterium]|nr:endolytic transglycosylase MltG [bacterium]